MTSIPILKLVATVVIGVAGFLFGSVQAFDKKYGKPKGDRRQPRPVSEPAP